MSKSTSTRRVVAVCVTLVAALAAIPSAGAQRTATKAAGADFKMMIISGFGGVSSNANPEILKGAQAAADRINKQGGLRGRKITLEGCSTQNSTSGDASCARKAVDQGFENVIWRSSFAAGSYKITRAAGIPSIGTIGTLTGDYTPKLSFPVIEATSSNDFVGALALAAKDPKNKVWAGLGVQNSGSALGVNQARTLARKYKRKYAGGILTPVLPVPDFQPIVQKLKGWNPDVVLCSCPVPHHIAWHAAMVQLGWHPRVIVTNTGTVTDAVISQFADGGKFPMIGGAGTPDATVPNRKNKLITAFRKDIAASGLSKDSVNYSSSSMAGWLAVDALGKLSKRIKGTVNKRTLIAAARKVKKTHPIDMYRAFKWAPGSPGPAAVPRFRAGTSYAHTWDAGAKRWVFKRAFDSWKILGYKLP